MKLRLYHHRDGARVAYREAGTGPPLALLHSAMLSYKEWEPIVDGLADRFRVVLPDLPLHGDSEDRPRHPYTPDWFADVLAGFCHEVLGAAAADRRSRARGRDPAAHGRARRDRARAPGAVAEPAASARGPRAAAARLAVAARAGRDPGPRAACSRTALGCCSRPDLGLRLSSRGAPGARDLVRHAFADVGGNANLARSWARFAARWPSGAQHELLDLYPQLQMPVLCCGPTTTICTRCRWPRRRSS